VTERTVGLEWTSQRRGDLIYGTGRDVSVRKREHGRIGRERRNDQGHFATAADLIVIVDRDLGGRSEQSPGTEFLGYDDDVAMGPACSRLMHPTIERLWNGPPGILRRARMRS